MLDGSAQVKVESGAADFSVFESAQAVSQAGVPLHRHRQYDEAFFIVEGHMTFVIGAKRVEGLGPGAFAFAPRGVAHGFANPGPGPARMLIIGSPRVQALVEEVAPLLQSNAPDMQAVAEAFARHHSEMLPPAGQA
jgi:mannose-6-phosphate isomerase-like protein (cupin superfamily)